MKLSRISGIVGGALSLVYTVPAIMGAIGISAGFSVSESLIPELLSITPAAAIFLLPAVVLLTRREFSPMLEKASLAYPIVLGLSMFHLSRATDPLEAGLPIVLLALPFCILFSIIFFFKK